MNALLAAIKAYNTYKGAESVAQLITDNPVVARFSGHFCFTCGVRHYFDDFLQDLEEQGIQAKIIKERQVAQDAYEVTYETSVSG